MSSSSRPKTTSTTEESAETEEIEIEASVVERSEPAADASSGSALPTRDQLIDEINQTYAYMEDVGAVLHEFHDAETAYWTYRIVPVRQFRNNVANMPFTDNPKEGTRAKAETGTAWITNPGRRSYLGRVFRPQGLTLDEERVYFNTFAGFGYDPLPGNCDLFWGHVRDNIANGDDQLVVWIQAWLAALIQHPELRASVALVLKGERGTGKGVFAQVIGKLLGQHFLHLTSPDVLTGKFNRILQDKPFVFADEAFWAGDKKGESRLKTLVTEDRIIIEEKYLPAYTVPNVIHLVIAGNDDWVVPAGRHERRFAVFTMADAHRQDRAYFKSILDQMESGGYEALLHQLQNFDLDACGVDPHVAPVTEALVDQQVLSMTPIEQFWYEALDEGRAIEFHDGWGEELDGVRCVGKDLLYQRYAERIATGRIHRPGAQQSFSKNIKKLMPSNTCTERKSVQLAATRGGHVERGLQRCFVVPSLSKCRAHFEKVFPGITWDITTSSLATSSRREVRAQGKGRRAVKSIPGLKEREFTLVETEYDDLIEPDWASDEPCVMGEA